MHCLHTLMMASTKQNLPRAFAFKCKSFICTSSGGLVICMKTILTTLNFHILLFPLKTSTSLSSITKKGEIVSASSATPSWFWSIDDKVGWGTNVFVRIAG